MNQNVKKLTGLALFTAIVVVLQIVGGYISSFLPVTISLVLVPIVVGAAVYGPKAGAYLGGVFGLVVLIYSITGVDKFSLLLWNAQPLYTAIICLGKGIFAGLAAGGVYSLVSKKNRTMGTILAAVVCPMINTGLFLLAMFFLFHDMLLSMAGGTNVIYFLFIGLAGVNFLVELGINVVLCPIITRIISARNHA